MDFFKAIESVVLPGATLIEEASERITNSIVFGDPLVPFLGLNQQVHVANASGQDIYVLPSPDVKWLIIDVLTDLALLYVGATEIKSAVMAGELPEAIETFKDLYKFLTVAAKLLSGTISVGSRSTEAALALIDAFKKVSLQISHGESKDVLDQGFLSTYLSPSGYAGMFGAGTVSLTIMSGDGKQVCQFNTGPDCSWISTSRQTIVRSKYGSLWQESPQDGCEIWPVR